MFKSCQETFTQDKTLTLVSNKFLITHYKICPSASAHQLFMFHQLFFSQYYVSVITDKQEKLPLLNSPNVSIIFLKECPKLTPQYSVSRTIFFK